MPVMVWAGRVEMVVRRQLALQAPRQMRPASHPPYRVKNIQTSFCLPLIKCWYVLGELHRPCMYMTCSKYSYLFWMDVHNISEKVELPSLGRNGDGVLLGVLGNSRVRASTVHLVACSLGWHLLSLPSPNVCPFS
jgi:hypothetical protein